MEKLKQMKEALVGCVQGQIYGNMEKVDAQELGAAVDMIKDLSEAIYYCTITEAMEDGEENEKEGKGKHGMMYYPRVSPMYYQPYPVELYDPRYRERYMPGSMYAQNSDMGSGNSSNGGSNGSGGNNARGGGTRGYHDGMMPIDHYPTMMRDPREGKSGERRKMYMEGKAQGTDKTKQMQELEEYMHELTTDVTEMIQDASPEEKQLLQQKINMLATKIK